MTDPRWFDAIATRRSRRRFDGRQLVEGAAEQLAALCDDFRPFPDVRAVFVPDADPGVYQGLLGPVGSYGQIRGAPSMLAFIGPEDAGLEVGYVGEALVLDAETIGVGTCWIAGSFDRRVAERIVPLAAGEKIHAVSPLGYAIEHKRGVERTLAIALKPTRRVPLHEIAPTMGDDWPLWAVEAVRAARLAPSGANRQPWSFRMDGDSLAISPRPKTYWTRELDCGIAMLHAELGAGHVGVPTEWELRVEDDYGRLTPRDEG